MTDLEIVTGELLPADVDGWVARIRATTARAIEANVELGTDFIAAKQALKGQRGGWGRLLDELGIHEKHAQRLMTIARHPVLANPTHASVLPSAYTTLEVLARLDEDQLTTAIAEGKVHTYTERSEAEDLVRQILNPAPDEGTPAEDDDPEPTTTQEGQSDQPEHGLDLTDGPAQDDPGAPDVQPDPARASGSQRDRHHPTAGAGTEDAPGAGTSSEARPGHDKVIAGAQFLNDIRNLLAAAPDGIDGLLVLAEGYRRGIRAGSIDDVHQNIRDLRQLTLNLIALTDCPL